MNKTTLIKLLKLLWILAAISVLCTTLYGHYMTHNPEVSLNGAITMSVLSMPSGLLVVFLLNIVAMIIDIMFSVTIPNNYFTIIATWSFLFMAGYFQWFKLVARILQKLRKKGGDRLE